MKKINWRAVPYSYPVVWGVLMPIVFSSKPYYGGDKVASMIVVVILLTAIMIYETYGTTA